jgi:hypothetical protein
VEQTQRIADGAKMCEYIIRPEARSVLDPGLEARDTGAAVVTRISSASKETE